MDQMAKEGDSGQTYKSLSRLLPPRIFPGKTEVGETASHAGATYSEVMEKESTSLNRTITLMAADDQSLSTPLDSDWASRIGVRVCIGGAKIGTLLFYGKTQFADGSWCGVMLDEPVGKNDGTVNGIRYFDCRQGYGIFAPPHKVFLTNIKNSNDNPKLPSNSRFSDLKSVQNGNRMIALSRPTNILKCSMTPARGSARPTKAKSKSGDLNSTITIAVACTDSQQNKVTNVTFDRVPAFDSELSVSRSSIECLQHDTTFDCVKTAGTRLLNYTYDFDNFPAESDIATANMTFTVNNENGVGNRDTFLPYEIAVTQRLSNVISAKFASNAESWNLDDKELDDDARLSQPAAVSDDGDFYSHRRGSADLDESLGILTPDQMKDFTLLADSMAAQTPSDEGIQEITEEEVIDIEAISKGGVNPTKVLEGFDEFDSRVVKSAVDAHNRKSLTPFQNNNRTVLLCEKKTSTPLTFFDNFHWTPTSKIAGNMSFGITDVRTPTLNSNQSYLDVESISLLKVDMSDITNDDHDIAAIKITKDDEENEKREPNVKLSNVAAALFEKGNGTSLAEETSSTLRSIVNDVAVSTNVSCSNPAIKDLSSSLKRDLPGLSTVREGAYDRLPLALNADGGAMEYLLQRMSNNFAENTQVCKKEEHPQQQMAVSITSIDTGYQGDAECDLQSDAGTNAANTPVEESSSSNKHFELPECVKGLKGGDPGSDSDFCSDMGASLTESEMDQSDERSRGRGARVIDGRLYYSKVSNVSKEIVSSNEFLASEDAHKSIHSQQEGTDMAFPASNENKDAQHVTIVTEEELQACLSDTDPDNVSANNTIVEVRTSVTTSTLIPGKMSTSPSVEMVVEPIEDISFSTPTLNGSFAKSENEIDQPASTILVMGATAEVKQFKLSSPSNDDEGPIVVENVVGQKVLPSKAPVNRQRSLEKAKITKKDLSATASALTIKKQKSPKKNVISKIKAMIVSTSSILTNKESPPSNAVSEPEKEHLGGGDGNAKSEPEKFKKPFRTPKKSRWDAVMSKIAAGQAEEKEKSKKQIGSRVNTNLTTSKINIPVTATVVSQAAGKSHSSERVPSTVKKVKPTSSKSEAAVTTGIRRPLFRGLVDAGSHAVDNSNHSHSDPSISQLSFQGKLRLPITAKPSRPSTLNLTGQPVATSSRPQSQASIRSCSSPGSALSHMSLASQASTRPPHDISFASCDQSYGCSSVKLTLASSRNVRSPRPSSVAVSVRRTNPSTLINSIAAKAANTHHATTSNPGKLRPFKPSTGLGKPGHHQQPQDACKAVHPAMTVLRTTGASVATAVKEVSRLEALCEARTKELNYSRIQLKHCVLGFDSFAVLLKYLTEDVKVFSAQNLNDQLQKAKEKLNITREHLDGSNLQQERLQEELIRFENAITELSSRMTREAVEAQEGLVNEHNIKIEELRDVHLKEIGSLIAAHATELIQLHKSNDEQLAKLQLANEAEQTKIVQNYLTEQQELVKFHRKDFKQLQEKHDQAESMSQEKIKELVSECASLKSLTQSLKEELTSDSDYRVQAASLRCSALQSEVDSLKVVLDMRQVELQELRKEKLESSCLSEDLQSARESLKKLEAKTEDLEARLAIRLRQERQLSSENQLLLDNFKKESYVSKRLSLENEELQWKLQQNKEMHTFLASIEGSDVAFSKGDLSLGSASMYFWDNEGLLNSSINGAGLGSSPKSSFSCFKGSTAEKLDKSPLSSSSPRGSLRISPCKLPINLFEERRCPEASTSPTTDNEKGVDQQLQTMALENEFKVEIDSKVQLRDKSSRNMMLPTVCDPQVTWSSLPISLNPDLLAFNDGAIGNGDALENDGLSEDLLVENEAFHYNKVDCSVVPNSENLTKKAEMKKVVIDFGQEKKGDLSDVCGVQLGLNEVPLGAANDTQILDVVNKECSEIREEVSLNLTSFHYPQECYNHLDLYAAEDEGSANTQCNELESTMSEEMCKMTNNSSSPITLSPFDRPVSKTTTVVISFRRNSSSDCSRRSLCSSRASSPNSRVNIETPTTSECCDTQSSESSSRASSLGREQVQKLKNQSQNRLDDRDAMGAISNEIGSPRVSAGESMVFENSLHLQHHDPAHLLLRKALQEQLLLDKCASSMESSPLTGTSKPDTPESLSQAVVPTDSSNVDLSWSDDDLPSETEV